MQPTPRHGGWDPSLSGPTLAQVAGTLLRHPIRELVRKWNYKSAITSSLARGLLFLVTNLSAGPGAAIAASAAEFTLRFATSGFYGALTQAFGQVRPARSGMIAALVCLPVLGHGLEFVTHAWRGTPNLGASVVASVALTVLSTSFTVFAMRRGVMVAGVEHARPLTEDLRRLPRLLVDFARAAGVEARRVRTAFLGLVLAMAVADIFADGAPDLAVRRFLERDAPEIRSYRARRHIEVVNGRFKARGWMEVITELDPEHGLRWQVVAEGGSRYVREHVIRVALDREVAAVRAGDPARAAVSPENYEFAPAPAGGDGEVAIGLRPRRRDVLLVSGSMLLDASGDLVEIRGRLSRNPSFWTTSVDVVRHYARIDGARVAVATDVVSSVRVAGPSQLRVVYDYEEINGWLVSPEARVSWPPPRLPH